LPHQSYEAFEKWAEETDFLRKVPSVIIYDNIAGTGRRHNVFKIPGNDTFLLRTKKHEFYRIKEIKKSEDLFPENNLGQEIATMGRVLQIIIKQDGTPNGIKDWYEFLYQFDENHLPEFIEKIQKIPKMEQKAFNELAEEISLIHDKGERFDYVNPANILIDEKKQAFNIVDVSDENYFEEGSIPIMMLYSLIDETNFLTAYNMADNIQRRIIIEAEQQIREKIKIAAKHNSIKFDENVFDNLLNYQKRLKKEMSSSSTPHKSGDTSGKHPSRLKTLLGTFFQTPLERPWSKTQQP